MRSTSPPLLTRPTKPMLLDEAAGAAAGGWYLQVVHGPGPEAPIALDGREHLVGRAAEAGADVVLPDPSVSRAHARLSWLAGDRLLVEDCGSSNGVRLGGRRIARAELRPGDVLRLGDSILVVGRGPFQLEGDEGDDLGLAGRSPPLRLLRRTIRRVAPSALPVLIAGDTGTGKELVARALHRESGRGGPFVAINCAALPPSLVESALFGHRRGAFTGATTDQDGAFAQAHGGTLLLDELGEMPLEVQPKLLRAIESLEIVPVGAARPIAVDVRIVAATNVPLDAAVAARRFRADLYARLAGVVLRTPTLAERREDVLPLFRRFLPRDARTAIVTPDFAESLLCHRWPHNVRELRKLAERLPVLHPEATRWERRMLDGEWSLDAALHNEGAAMHNADAALHDRDVAAQREDVAAQREDVASQQDDVAAQQWPPAGREELEALLARHRGNVSLLARAVGRNRKQVYRWMERLGLAPRTGRR